MKTLRFQNILLFICVLATALTCCKPKQKIISSTTPVEEKENNELFSDILEQSFDYGTLASKVTMNVEMGTRSLSSKAQVRIVRDKALQVSIQPLFGVEMFRFHIDPDSLVVLDRMNKRYVKESLTTLKEIYPVGFDYYTLQSLFTNSLFVSSKESAETTDYRQFEISETPDAHYQLQGRDKNSGITYSFIVNGDDRITSTHLLSPNKTHSVEWNYSNFSIVSTQAFPYKMDISALVSDKTMNVAFIFSDISLNAPMELSVSVPASYTKTTVAELLKILKAK
ncbi:MAG TPA: hypothetical protein DDZ96_13915 [Porphyromonadaceae bacterium]|jgi:hypothetical protein|nr:hypothetical protein [Porphyromonadaceae bacterium]HBL34888.1 hypothetical protein [Porphyromonadaceae bacterium]HBX21815.1 hypothetical protein [Porphyromonadaceae bacterium]HCM19806.1 hypothetical protein [Porphyromonadaceae bacterium]